MNDPRSDPRQAVVDRVLAFWPEIVVAARAHGLEPGLLAGLVCQESGGNPDAMRVEPGFRWVSPDFADHRPQGMSADTEKWGRMTSWGLCQLMGQVARERGFRGWWPALCQPDLNLTFGARHLALALKRESGDEARALQVYNTGRGEVPPGPDAYCRKVLGWAERFTNEPALAVG